MPRRKPQKWQRHRNSHLATEYPKIGKCSECGRTVLVGPVDGLTTKFDPYLLSQKGEAEALIRRLRTFHANHPMFTRRTVSAIKREPVPIIGSIIREHRCSTPEPIPAALADPKRYDLPDECPF